MEPTPALVACTLLAAGLAGCAAPAGSAPPPAVLEALADTRAMDWSKGNWWAYQATVGNVSFDVALIVHELRADSRHLGTNLSTGFFGLPWTGNVTTELNPRIGPDEWRLFDFPLTDGKEWSYTMLGHEAKTTARATTFHVPGLGLTPGFRLESTTYGQVFARYNYVPATGWFTQLALIEPTDGHTILDAHLTAYGHDWHAAYYVEQTIREVRVDYPAAPGRLAIAIPSGFLQVRALLTAETTSGVVDAQLKDAAGRLLAAARVVGKGADTERASARTGEGLAWTLDHVGAPAGTVHLMVTGLAATGPLAATPTPPDVHVDLPFHPHSTRPAWPQPGQTTSTALPVG